MISGEPDEQPELVFCDEKHELKKDGSANVQCDSPSSRMWKEKSLMKSISNLICS